MVVVRVAYFARVRYGQWAVGWEGHEFSQGGRGGNYLWCERFFDRVTLLMFYVKST